MYDRGGRVARRSAHDVLASVGAARTAGGRGPLHVRAHGVPVGLYVPAKQAVRVQQRARRVRRERAGGKAQANARLACDDAVPVQLRLAPLPETAKPGVQVHDDAPAELVLPDGQVVHELEPARL